MVRAKAKTLHRHSCASCRAIYHDVCDTPDVNGRCNPCRSGIPSSWNHGLEAQPCCLVYSRLARKDEIERYRLAGSTVWWICQTCQRTFAANPKGIR